MRGMIGACMFCINNGIFERGAGHAWRPRTGNRLLLFGCELCYT